MPEIDVCEHNGEMKANFEQWLAEGNTPLGVCCGITDTHGAHEDCFGLMCDYGCNAENF